MIIISIDNFIVSDSILLGEMTKPRRRPRDPRLCC